MGVRPTPLTENRKDRLVKLLRILTCQMCRSDTHALPRVNLTIVRQRAEWMKQQGGEGTGGKMGADEIRFSNEKSADASGGEETVEGPDRFSDKEMRAMWLRRVQTKPADFLRAKFIYQQAAKEKTR